MVNNYSCQDFLSVARRITYDATIPELLEEAIRNHEGRLSNNGALCVTTGKHTGRSPKDRFIVDTQMFMISFIGQIQISHVLKILLIVFIIR